MEVKRKFEVAYLQEALEFLQDIEDKARDKIIYNIDKATYVMDPKLFKKLEDTDIWEFRTQYNNKQYRLLAFWDKTGEKDTLVIATHGFIKKTDKTPLREIEKANNIMKEYFK
ncbi:type II toxin-antitoxin system RelE/ParE family toxin [Bacteroides sp. 519]|uniref:type II toxin-antitoxin system RelE/ParE family toxin n=1 Tax=Bacteroides sp. 519 TaxID=2302937 RepID=UPI0013D1E041|nr:type II toxin-antitoxin system RelE/ParE family toxin [Bacteroides sp. 519]NDV59843.1 type II toxin-antitoxin system RelE/ParE family toxin [Bacteroides sp. 519]